MITLIFNLSDVLKDGLTTISNFFFQDWLFTTLFTFADKPITPASLLFGYGLVVLIRVRISKIIIDFIL